MRTGISDNMDFLHQGHKVKEPELNKLDKCKFIVIFYFTFNIPLNPPSKGDFPDSPFEGGKGDVIKVVQVI
jgi:hypothetical protein